MSIRVRAMAAVVALLLLPTTAAVAKFAMGGAPSHATAYRGTNGAGRVTFTAWNLYYASAPSVYLTNFRFTNPCSGSGTRVRARIKVTRRHYHFHYHANGITIDGSLNEHGGSSFVYGRATGIIRVRSDDPDDCDRGGVVKFTAKQK